MSYKDGLVYPTIILNKINEVDYETLIIDPDQMRELKESMSCYAAGYAFHPKFKARMWNGKIYYYDMYKKTFPIGLLGGFKKFCKKFNYEFDIIGEIAYSPLKLAQFNGIIKETFKDTKFVPRDYQSAAIYKGLDQYRGVLRLATGAGKSLVIYSLIRCLLHKSMGNNKIILIVPSVSLVEQMYTDFKEYGWDCDDIEKLYSGKKPTFKKKVLITTYQSIMNKREAFFKDYNVAINDECHGAKAKALSRIMSNLVNAKWRIGLTGTMPSEKSDMMNVLGALGPVLHDISSDELIKMGILSKIRIAACVLDYPDKVRNLNNDIDYQNEMKFIESHKPRMKTISKILDVAKFDDNILILCQKLDHLKNIEDHLNELHKDWDVKIIHGGIPAKKREKIRLEIENNTRTVLIGTFGTLSTGINVKRLHHVVFASPSKSEIRVLQSIGRGLRTHSTKSEVILWDLIDDFRKRSKRDSKKFLKRINYGLKQWLERKKYYSQQNFPVKEIKMSINQIEIPKKLPDTI